MSLLSDGASLLQSALPTTVQYRLPSGQSQDLIGVWTGQEYGKDDAVGMGAVRTDADAFFHVRQGELTEIDRRAKIHRGLAIYEIAQAEQVQDYSWRLHLKREQTRASGPNREKFRG